MTEIADLLFVARRMGLTTEEWNSLTEAEQKKLANELLSQFVDFKPMEHNGDE